MPGKSSKPVIEVLTSPRCHVEPKAQSTRGLKGFDLGGVGLGIVTALEKPGSASNALFGRHLSRSNPIPMKSRNKIPFHISPAKMAGVPPPDFLSACNLCRKQLHGIDIYMYRGEKAFCSTECRYKQMRVEERKEKCISEASRPPREVVGSPYADDKILNTGIFANIVCTTKLIIC